MGARRRPRGKDGIRDRNAGVKERRRCVKTRICRWSGKAREQRADRAIRVIVARMFVVRGAGLVIGFARRRSGQLNTAARRRPVPPAVDPPADDMHQRVQTGAQDAHQAHEGQHRQRGRSSCRWSGHELIVSPRLRRRVEARSTLLGQSPTDEALGTRQQSGECQGAWHDDARLRNRASGDARRRCC